MKTCLLFIISISFLPSILFAQNGNSSEAERINLLDSYISYLQDSVVVKGRLLHPLREKDNSLINPISNGIIDAVPISPYGPFPEITQLRDNEVFLYRSDKDGVFNFKLPRGRYIFNFYSDEFDTDNLLMEIHITDNEIKEKEIDLGDIRFNPYFIKICFDDRPYHIVLREREIAAMREARREKRAKRAGKFYRKGRREHRKLIS